MIIDAFDWGPASVQAIVSLPDSCPESELCPFSVTEISPYGEKRTRSVTDVYLSDAEGNRATEESSYVSIEMDLVPMGTGSLFYFNLDTFLNEFSTQYQLIIKPETGASDFFENLSVDPTCTEMMIPDLERFESDVFADGDIRVNYSVLEPSEDGKKHPLIIWLHGQGEGGSDPAVSLLGNRVTAFAEEDIQNAFSGAYILIPQCPGYWSESRPNDGMMGTNPDGTSAYTEILMHLIEKTVEENDGIDSNRVYIGGCSMGGYMTLNMLFTYPDYFAAAFPVCAFYPDTLIDDEKLSVLADTPLWYVYCSSDETVPPSEHSEATLNRLLEKGASVHTSVYADVHDTTGKYFASDGTPVEYYPHWAWVYVLNSDCRDGDLSLWQFLAAQSRE
jgi:predicted esterase